MSKITLPKWFYALVSIALLWNLMGIANFFLQINLTPEDISALPEAEQVLMNNTPLWSTIAFALGVFWWKYRMCRTIDAKSMVDDGTFNLACCGNCTNELLALFHHSGRSLWQFNLLYADASDYSRLLAISLIK